MNIYQGISTDRGDSLEAGPDPEPSETRKDLLWALSITVVLCVTYHLLARAFNLNMRDEGYLWYGVQQVLRGDVPLRDFQSYDPGRYYWCAWLAPIFGSGIIGIRASLVLFGGLGMLTGLLVIRRFVPNRAWLIPAALMLGLSMFPRHKLFEPAIILCALWSTTRLIEKPSIGRTFFAGLVIGLAAFFGRNHGLYLLIAYTALFLLSLWKRLDPRPWRSAAVLSSGICLGYAPQLFMLAAVPGYAQSFKSAVLSLKTLGSNIGEPYRWPWTEYPDPEALVTDTSWVLPYSSLALDAAYLLPVIVLPLGLILVLIRKQAAIRRHAGLAASIFVGIPYAYHYGVRSDVPHLFQAIQPVLLASLGLVALARPSQLRTGIAVGALLLIGVFVGLSRHPELKHLLFDAERVQVEIHGDVLSLPEPLAQDIEMLRAVVERALPADEEIFILPTMPTYYPILGKRSPSWWIYMLWRNTPEEQDSIIADLEARNIRSIITIARPFNREAEYNLNETNPRLWDYILRNYGRVVTPPQFPMPIRIHLWRHN